MVGACRENGCGRRLSVESFVLIGPYVEELPLVSVFGLLETDPMSGVSVVGSACGVGKGSCIGVVGSAGTVGVGEAGVGEGRVILKLEIVGVEGIGTSTTS